MMELQCIKEQCRSPIACGGFGYCRELNFLDYVIRYVPTYLNKHGQRTLMRAAQGRNTFATEQEAQEWIEAVTRNNSNGIVTQIWGADPQFAVRPCKCWPGHFDPKSVYFDD